MIVNPINNKRLLIAKQYLICNKIGRAVKFYHTEVIPAQKGYRLLTKIRTKMPFHLYFRGQ